MLAILLSDLPRPACLYTNPAETTLIVGFQPWLSSCAKTLQRAR